MLQPAHRASRRSYRSAPTRRWFRWLLLPAILIVAIICSATYAIDRYPEAVSTFVDAARAWFGPQPVAQVESWMFELQDQVRWLRYKTTGAVPTLHLAQAPAHPAPSSVFGSELQPLPTVVAHPRTLTSELAPSVQPTADTTGAPAISAPNWSPYLVSPNGVPLIERTVVAPDPDRPYVQVVLVRIDLTATQLHLVAGTVEPISAVATARHGTIPQDVLTSGRLIAAFNGGFKAANGHYGISANGVVLLPAQDGLATLAIYRNGSVRLGSWGTEITPSPDIIAFRQNCPLLLDNGVMTAEAEHPTTDRWGKTVGNTVTTWRSGLGLSADGQTLIYAVGDGLTVASLAEALREGGAVRAMQLDINSLWTRFVTFSNTAHVMPQAQKLLDDMQGDRRQFIAPDTRDFFYLTRQF